MSIVCLITLFFFVLYALFVTPNYRVSASLNAIYISSESDGEQSFDEGYVLSGDQLNTVRACTRRLTKEYRQNTVFEDISNQVHSSNSFAYPLLITLPPNSPRIDVQITTSQTLQIKRVLSETESAISDYLQSCNSAIKVSTLSDVTVKKQPSTDLIPVIVSGVVITLLIWTAGTLFAYKKTKVHS